MWKGLDMNVRGDALRFSGARRPLYYIFSVLTVLMVLLMPFSILWSVFGFSFGDSEIDQSMQIGSIASPTNSRSAYPFEIVIFVLHPMLWLAAMWWRRVWLLDESNDGRMLLASDMFAVSAMMYFINSLEVLAYGFAGDFGAGMDVYENKSEAFQYGMLGGLFWATDIAYLYLMFPLLKARGLLRGLVIRNSM